MMRCLFLSGVMVLVRLVGGRLISARILVGVGRDVQERFVPALTRPSPTGVGRNSANCINRRQREREKTARAEPRPPDRAFTEIALDPVGAAAEVEGESSHEEDGGGFDGGPGAREAGLVVDPEDEGGEEELGGGGVGDDGAESADVGGEDEAEA